jgi:oligopeptidase B
VFEYEEWGNPADPEVFDYLMSYSPYHNIEDKEYPHMLITAGLNDPRVSYSEPAKFVAKLRKMKQNTSTLLLKTYLHGHMGASGKLFIRSCPTQ